VAAEVSNKLKGDNVAMNETLSTTANLLGDPGRAAILLRLMNGIALPAGELAMIANVSPQTASEHLAKLLQGRLLSVERQGRHRYYRLANSQVADALESLLVLTAPQRRLDAKAARANTGTIEHARTCYGHLAGWLGVRVAEALQERAFIKEYNAKTYAVTPSGREWFEALKIKVPVSAIAQEIKVPPSAIAQEIKAPASSIAQKIQVPVSTIAQNKLVRRCLDWTERRHHIAGTLGCAMYKRFRELRWLLPVRDTRVLRITVEGRAQFWKLLRIPVA
jgi:DNA-binding transcriptional ArsR family regulator